MATELCVSDSAMTDAKVDSLPLLVLVGAAWMSRDVEADGRPNVA